MTRRTGRTARNLLSARRVQTLTEPGRYPDGGNLYLQVQVLPDKRITKSWIFRYMSPDGRRPEMGLGPMVDVSLADARAKATEYRQMLRDGLDPLQERRQKRQEARLAASRAIKFKDCSAAYIEAHAPAWRNAKHKTQWERTLSTYAYPVMGHLTVSDIGTDHVLRVLEPIWNSKRETARRLRARIERVLSWAATRGYRSDSNPARWQGNLKNLLAADSKTQPVKHHPALPYHQVKDFARKLRKQSGVAALALEFTILTAARTSEVILARWEEVNLKRKEWVVPGERMKSGRPHRVPLSKAAIAVLRRVESLDEDLVFPAPKGDGAISNMAMLALLRRMGVRGVTVHGFRSTFRDWAAEQTSYPNHVIEMALAHVISDKVERAYRRGELLEKRRRLMNDWANYLV